MTGYVIGLVGPPGCGKSHFVQSGRKIGKLAAALGMYRENDNYLEGEYEVFIDRLWRPSSNRYQAGGWSRFMKWMDKVEKDNSIQVVGVDPFSKLQYLAWHDVMKDYGTDNPQDLQDPRSPWMPFRSKIVEAADRFDCLAADGKGVVVTFHEQIKEMEGAGAGKKNKKGETVWDEKRVPEILSGLRDSFSRHFSFWLYGRTEVIGMNETRYFSRLADVLTPAKVNISLDGLDPRKIPNDLTTLLGAIRIVDPNAGQSTI